MNVDIKVFDELGGGLRSARWEYGCWKVCVCMVEMEGEGVPVERRKELKG
jgi:hypothetical protein